MVDTSDLPSMFLEMHVERDCNMVIGQHQRDTRGLPGSHPESEYHSIRISVLGPAANGTGYELAGRQSFAGSREAELEQSFKKSPRPYYLFFSRTGSFKRESRLPPAMTLSRSPRSAHIPPPLYTPAVADDIRAAGSRARSFVVSIHHEARDFGRIRVLVPTAALMDSIQYDTPCPYGPFAPEACRQVEVECQWGTTREALLTKRQSSSYSNSFNSV